MHLWFGAHGCALAAMYTNYPRPWYMSCIENIQLHVASQRPVVLGNGNRHNQEHNTDLFRTTTSPNRFIKVMQQEVHATQAQ